MIENQETVLLAGGTGFIGAHLGKFLAEQGFNIKVLTTQKNLPHEVFPCTFLRWDGTKLPPHALDDVTYIINLCGQNIMKGFLSKGTKKKLYDSRIIPTKAIVNALNHIPNKVECFINASAIGIYDFSNPDFVTENSQLGQDFLANLCQDWEAESQKVTKKIRVINPRFGLVLGHGGGALKELIKLYSLGLGARLASGKQFMNFVHIKDLVRAIHYAMTTNNFTGAFNVVAPENCSNAEFHKRFKSYFRSRLNFLVVPKFALHLLLQKRASQLVISPLIKPQRLQEQSAFNFLYPNLSSTLKDLMTVKS